MADERYNYDAYHYETDGRAVQDWLHTGPKLGSTAPDFELDTFDGIPVSLRALSGRPVVLEFGSYTCPMFCGHLPAMEDVATRHPEATFLIVYTREAHPGELAPPHRSGEEKRQAIQTLIDTEHPRRTILLDSVDGVVHRRYGGGSNAVYLIGPDGTVLLRRAWNDPTQIDRALDALRDGGRVEPTESTDMARTDRWPFGYWILRAGGRRALRDFYESGPPALKERLRASESDEVRAALPNPGGA